MVTGKSNSTIVALSTAIGYGAIAVIRVSGPETLKLLGAVFKPKKAALNQVEPKRAMVGDIVDSLGKIVDNVVLVYFRSPASYTGEDMAEISCHGSGYIVNRIITLLIESGAVAATQGEFTKRAFLNGKMDLLQAEAVSAIIAAEGEVESRIALSQLKGTLSNQLQGLKNSLTNILVTVEAVIDFPEENLISLADIDLFRAEIKRIYSEIERLVASFKEGRRITKGIKVVLVGQPNAGKSSLFNAICEKERVIVDAEPGTTRDTVEETIILAGRKVILVDTAGIREAKDRVESLGIELAKKVAHEADIILEVIDSTNGAKMAALEDFAAEKITIMNKADLIGESVPNNENCIYASSKTGLGLDEIKQAVIRTIPSTEPNEMVPVITNMRQFECLSTAASLTKEVIEMLDTDLLVREEIIAQLVRRVLNNLGQIIGTVSDDDVLHKVFSQFCVGK